MFIYNYRLKFCFVYKTKILTYYVIYTCIYLECNIDLRLKSIQIKIDNNLTKKVHLFTHKDDTICKKFLLYIKSVL